MNLLLFEEGDLLPGGRAAVSGRRKEHLIRVNGIRAGDELVCGLLNGKKGRAAVREISSDQVRFTVSFTEPPPEKIPLTLVLALPRPKMLRRIIQHVTALGVKQIFLINSWRVEKSFWKSPVLEEAALREQMILGLEQCGDTVLPEIHIRRFFKEFMDDDLAPIAAGSEHFICAHPKGALPCPSAVCGNTVAAVGPEGGWIDREVHSFETHGFAVRHMGERILRVETAVTSLISRLYQ